MYVDQTAFIVALSICFVFGLLSSFVAVSYILPRYVKVKSVEALRYELRLEQKRQLIIKQQEEIREKTEAIKTIVYGANHKGLNPLCKTLRGMLNLIRMSCTNQRTIEYIDKAEQLVLSIEKQIMKDIKEIEKLQE